MNPVTMSDPTGMYPTCERDNGCTSQYQAQSAYNNAAYAAGGSRTCNCTDYNPIVTPAPAPPINFSALPSTFVAKATYSLSQQSGHVANNKDYWGWTDQNSNLGAGSVTREENACTGFWGCLGHGAFVGYRATMNAPYTIGAVGLAYASGGGCDAGPELSFACYGTASWADGLAGGMTVGNTFLTETSREDFAARAARSGTTPERIFDHERTHSTHWLVFGPATPTAYGIDWGVHWADECRMWLEQSAGLADGGYDEC